MRADSGSLCLKPLTSLPFSTWERATLHTRGGFVGLGGEITIWPKCRRQGLSGNFFSVKTPSPWSKMNLLREFVRRSTIAVNALTAAGRGAALAASRCTSRTASVTLASFWSAASANWGRASRKANAMPYLKGRRKPARHSECRPKISWARRSVPFQFDSVFIGVIVLCSLKFHYHRIVIAHDQAPDTIDRERACQADRISRVPSFMLFGSGRSDIIIL